MSDPGPVRLRREPPRFRHVSVDRVRRLGSRLVRVTLAGPELEGLTVDQPAASVRVLFPAAVGGRLEMPLWNGNEFLLADGSRAPIRTFTPGFVDPTALELDIDVVLHAGGGVASPWAARAAVSDEVAVSGPGRGYVVEIEAPGFVLVGDESAIPAVSQLLEAVPATVPVRVHVEVAAPDGRVDLPHHPGAVVAWHDLPAGAPPGEAMIAAVEGADLPAGTRVWVAGEAAAVQRIRRHLFEERGLSRAQATVRGYWKHGRGGDEADDT